MKNRAEDEARQKYPDPQSSEPTPEENNFVTEMAWGLAILLGIGIIDYLFI